MIKLAARRLVLTGLGLLAIPVSVQAQAATGDMFGIPWSGVSAVELLDEGDVTHLSASRSADFERLGLQADRHCRDLAVQASMGGDPQGAQVTAAQPPTQADPLGVQCLSPAP